MAMVPGIVCAHCGTPTPTGSAPSTPWFCCAGCRTASEVIRACGLGEFYRLRTLSGAALVPAAGGVAGDASAVTVQRRADGLEQVEWYVEGMHCAACAWLLEQLPRLQPGVRQARIDPLRAHLTVVMEPGRATPAEQAGLIARLGYRARPYRDADRGLRREWRDLLLRTVVASASALAAMHLSINLYAGELTRDLDASGARMFALLTWAVALPGLTWAAAPVWRGALASWRAGRVGVDLSAALVLLVGGTMSVLGAVRGGGLYLDALTMFVALLLIGRAAVLAARVRVAAAGDSLAGWLPLMARRIAGDPAIAQPVRIVELRRDDVVVVTHDEVVPCDGILIGTGATIDVAVLTGESRPVTVDAGGEVLAGSTCRSPELRLRVTAAGSDTRLGHWLAEAAAAAQRPSRLIQAVDRIQAAFLALTLIAAIATVAGWWLVGDLQRGVVQAIAVVLVSCPCALGLAAPLAQAVTMRRLVEQGLLVRDASALEALADLGRPGGIRQAVFDKTGTLTEGRMRVVDWRWRAEVPDAQRSSITAAVAGAEMRSRHPVASALVAHLAEVPPAEITAWREVPAGGVVCMTTLGELRIGNTRLLGQPLSADPARTVIGVVLAERMVAEIHLEDPLRPQASSLLGDLRARGVALRLWSGDAREVVAAVGTELGFEAADLRSGCTPEDKASALAGLRTQGGVLMVGDGLNDAAALAQADVAIGLRGGLHAALDCCGLFVARGEALTGVRRLLAEALTARQRLVRILVVAGLYNVVGMALAAGGVWGPYLCAVAMPLSSLSVVWLALRRS